MFGLISKIKNILTFSSWAICTWVHAHQVQVGFYSPHLTSRKINTGSVFWILPRIPKGQLHGNMTHIWARPREQNILQKEESMWARFSGTTKAYGYPHASPRLFWLCPRGWYWRLDLGGIGDMISLRTLALSSTRPKPYQKDDVLLHSYNFPCPWTSSQPSQLVNTSAHWSPLYAA